MIKGNLITIGKIIKLSGESGELIVFGQTLPEKVSNKQNPVFIELEGEHVPFYIKDFKSINKEKHVVLFEYVTNVRKAENLIGKNIEILSSEKRKKSEENILGFSVFDQKHGNIGVVKLIDAESKNPLLVIDRNGIEIYVPFREEFILSIDKKEKRVEVAAPEGLLDLYL